MRVYMKRSRDTFWCVQISLVLLALMLFYIVLHSEVFLHGMLSVLTGMRPIFSLRFNLPENVLLFVLRSGTDLVLGYGLMMVLSCFFRKERFGFRNAFMLSVSTEVLAGASRIFITGNVTMSFLNIGIQILFSLFALLVIMIHERKIW